MKWYHVFIFMVCVNFAVMIVNGLEIFSDAVTVPYNDMYDSAIVATAIGAIMGAAIGALVSQGAITIGVLTVISSIFWVSFSTAATILSGFIPALYLYVLTGIYFFVFIAGIIQIVTGMEWSVNG